MPIFAMGSGKGPIVRGASVEAGMFQLLAQTFWILIQFQYFLSV